MNSKNAPQSGNVDFFLNNFIEAGTSGEKDPFAAAAQQMVENSYDANATKISFEVEPGKHFRCTDDGIGVQEEKVHGLNRLGFRNKDFDQTGKNGTGRVFNMKIAEETHNRFTSADYERVMLHRFTRDHVRKILTNPTAPLDNPVQEDPNVPQWCKLDAQNTGMAVELVNIDWSHFTSINMFRRRLSNILSVWMAEKTYVNEEPLPPRKMSGTPHKGKVDIANIAPKLSEAVMKAAEKLRRQGAIETGMTPEALNACEYFFYQTPNPTKSDRIFFGRNPLISVDDFLAGVQDDVLVDQLSAYSWLRGRTVAGFIDLPIVNQFAHHDRSKLNPSIYEDPELIEEIIYLLIDHIAPKLQDHFELQEDEDEVAENRSDLEQLASLFPSVRSNVVPPEPVGDPPTKLTNPVKKPDIAISPPKAEKYMIGEEEVFKVVYGPRNGKWRWARNNPGGTLDIETGPQVWCTFCDTPGKYTLEYISPDGKKAKVPIELVEEAPFTLTKGLIDLHPGERKTVWISNYDGDDVTFTFDGDERTVRHLQCIPQGGKGAEFVAEANCPPGFYSFTAKSQSEPDKEAHGVVKVHEYPGKLIPMGNRLYDLKSNTTPGAPVVDIERWYASTEDAEDRFRVMRINMTADPLATIEAQEGKGSAFYKTALMLAATAHAQDVKEENPIQAACDIVTSALKKTKKKRSTSKRKKNA